METFKKSAGTIGSNVDIIMDGGKPVEEEEWEEEDEEEEEEEW